MTSPTVFFLFFAASLFLFTSLASLEDKLQREKARSKKQQGAQQHDKLLHKDHLRTLRVPGISRAASGYISSLPMSIAADSTSFENAE